MTDQLSDFPEQRVLNRVLGWYRRRRFITAYRILRNEYERHRDAGHNVHFRAANEAHIDLECINCPWHEPQIQYEDDWPGWTGDG
jgi:hypothetical protein